MLELQKAHVVVQGKYTLMDTLSQEPVHKTMYDHVVDALSRLIGSHIPTGGHPALSTVEWLVHQGYSLCRIVEPSLIYPPYCLRRSSRFNVDPFSRTQM